MEEEARELYFTIKCIVKNMTLKLSSYGAVSDDASAFKAILNASLF